MYADKVNQLIDLIKQANEYTRLYDLGTPAITDKEWDNLYFEIKALEDELQVYPQNSPTQSIPFEVVSSLRKVEHNHKMLSLQKTKDLNDVADFIRGNVCLAMAKMDGLTCSLTYEDGKLVRAETRGNGLVGEDILHNILHLPSVPRILSIKGEVIIDGEIICTYNNFTEFATEYKNPRNFAAGSIRLLDSKECKKRKLTFVAWDIIKGFDDLTHLKTKLSRLKSYGFYIVPYTYIYGKEISLENSINYVKEAAKACSYPIDGIVFKFNDIEYGKSLGETAHHFKNAIAYKFYDDTYETKLLNIEWTMGRTGVLTPVAIFEPVEIDGSIVERASLHNCSIMYELFGPLGPHRFQKIEVFKSNMIIPQVKSVQQTDLYEENKLSIPKVCPVCGGKVIHKSNNNSIFLICDNPDCNGKLINKLDHFCGKKGLDIKGLSKATLEKLIDWNWVDYCYDLFALKNHRDEWIKKPGFGAKSVDNILAAIENSRLHCELYQFISAIGIPLIGLTASKQLANYFTTWDNFIEAINSNFHFYDLSTFGPEMDRAIISFNYDEAINLVNNYIHFNSIIIEEKEETLKDKVFVITGKLQKFKNREELKNKIESLGGKVTGSVSNKTDYLINNDQNSTSVKNVTAKTLNIPILSEEEFMKLLDFKS